MSLATDDIQGAGVSSKGLGNFASRPRQEFRQTMKVDDIAGTSASSLLKAPKTNRVSNPLNPEYVAPGEMEYKGTTRHMMDRLGEERPAKVDRAARAKPKYPDIKQKSDF